MLTTLLFGGIFSIWTFLTTERKIEDPNIGDAAMELIYKEEYFTYGLTSIRSNNITITSKEPQNSSLERNSMPSIRVTIEDSGIGDTAMELIYEDEYFTYYLTSIRSNTIMITFEDGQVITLSEAIDREKITITDLILNGLDVVTRPKN